MSNQPFGEEFNEKQDLNISRWRLILGKRAEKHGISFGTPYSTELQTGKGKEKGKSKERLKARGKGEERLNGKDEGEKERIIESKSIGSDSLMDGELGKTTSIDETLNTVYETSQQKRSADLSGTRLSIPKWIENVKNFFPIQTREMLEKDLVKGSNIADLIDHPELFEKVEPSLEMVKTIITLKHMLPENVKDVARKLVKKVVDQLKEKLKTEVEKHIVGAIKRDIHTPLKVFRNIDWKQSIRRNLKNYNPKIKKLIMAEPRFFSNERRKKAWQIIVLVDESGSMADSIIYSVVMASIFSSLPAIHTNLVVFDTQVVDLTSRIDDPVDVLMSVQLGGGTDITAAVRYGQQLIKNPKKTLLAIISDFFEGRNENELTKAIRHVLEGGSKVLGIASLGSNAKPCYNKQYAKKLNSLGIDVIASTPEKLPELIARLMNK